MTTFCLIHEITQSIIEPKRAYVTLLYPRITNKSNTLYVSFSLRGHRDVLR